MIKGGYWGRILRVDLTNGRTETATFDEAYARKYLGGVGFGAKLVSDEVTKHTNPLGPGNLLVFATGPYQATNVASSGRCTVCAKSPLTGYWGESNAGGNIGPQLKRCGFDALAIAGKAHKPVYLHISDNQADIKDADQFWGMDIVETTDAVRESAGDKSLGVTAIGPAGENLVRYACIGNENHGYFGRCGLGAVMGSKNLKAIVARGSLAPPIAEPDKLKELYTGIRNRLQENVSKSPLRVHGQAMAMTPREGNGLLPMKNWGQDNWPEVEKIAPPRFTEEAQVKPWGCPYCIIGCHRRVTNPDFFPADTGGPEYETLAMIGSNLLIDDLPALVKANELLNRYGIDTIEVGAVLGWAFESYENGLIAKEDTGGIELTWGSGDALLAMCEKICRRDGIGSLMAEGLRACVDAVPGSEEYAVEAMGQAVAAHDPRAYYGMTVSTIASTRGSCHLHGNTEGMESGRPLPNLGIDEPVDRFDNENKGLIGAISQDSFQVDNSLTVCICYGGMGMANKLKMLEYITGWEGITEEETMKTGERVVLLQHLFNLKMGLIPEKENVMPMRFTKPHKGGGAAGKVPDWRKILREYWHAKGWDEHGIPTEAKIKELGLDE